MYNLAKLLTEEPEKLERIGIIILKLLITLLVYNELFDTNFSVIEITKNPIPKDYTISNIVVSIILVIVIWNFIWSLIAEIVLGDFLIWLVSKTIKSENIFLAVLEITGVVKKISTEPNKKIIVFNNIIQNFSSEDEKYIVTQKSRIKQYYVISIVIFIGSLFFKEITIPLCLKFVGGFVVLNNFILCVFLSKIHEYIIQNFLEIKHKFEDLAFTQKCFVALYKHPLLIRNYQSKIHSNRIVFEKISEDLSFPRNLTFYPISYWNNTLNGFIISEFIKKISQNKDEKDNVIISNIELKDEDIKLIKSLNNLSYIYCKDDEQIIKHVDLFLFKVTGRLIYQ